MKLQKYCLITIMPALIIFSVMSLTLNGDAKENSSEPTLNSVESSNIIELESKKFLNVTSNNKTLTVYKVFNDTILVIESHDDTEVIKLN